MEQAVNTMSKGLQLDINPMVQNNDTMSDCLNGTIVTMNGNEVILQNDMGNRRVNNAFLPPGYQPIGIKEYGGIIYIAAYNPITNKSQIGSFPSPQKKFNDVDGGGNLDLDKFFDQSNIFRETFYLNPESSENNQAITLEFIKSDTQFVPLTKDSSIYPGDKFVVYCDNLDPNKITNYDNVGYGDQEYKIYSPKNKDYTLFIGVLNSQNEFMDITPTLNRWQKNNKGEWEIINFNNYDYEVSEKYKFNKGYFIPRSYNNGTLSETQNDAEFIRARQALPVNTYSSKLIGPMYLKAQFNHVQNFDYNITGYKDETSGRIELIIEGIFTYNCQDQENNQIQNEIYWSSRDLKFTNQAPSEYIRIQQANQEIVQSGGSVFGESSGGVSGSNSQSIQKIDDNSKTRFSVEDNLTEDSNIYTIDYLKYYADLDITYSESNYQKQYIVSRSNEFRIIVTLGEYVDNPKITKYNDQWILSIPFKSTIEVFSLKDSNYVETIEFNGDLDGFELLPGQPGQVKGNTWNAQGTIPRIIRFTCDSGIINQIKIKLRDVSARKDQLNYEMYNEYIVVKEYNGKSQFSFDKPVELKFTESININSYITRNFVPLNGNTLYSGSCYIQLYEGLSFYKNEENEKYFLKIDPGARFVVDMQYGYSLGTIEIQSNGTNDIQQYLSNGVYDGSDTNIKRWNYEGKNQSHVEFRHVGERTSYIYKIIVTHDGITDVPDNASISRTFTGYEIYEQLLRRGRSVSIMDSREFTIIYNKSISSYGLYPNPVVKTCKVMCNECEQPIAYGHFETYNMSQQELNYIDDGVERNINDYDVLYFMWDEVTDKYKELINSLKQIRFEVGQDAFGNKSFYEYITNTNEISSQECISNAPFTFTVNLI